MLHGLSGLNLDDKGRLAIPSGYRTALLEGCQNRLVITLSPLDRCLWLYPLPEWEIIDVKLNALSDFDKQSRRTKQMMRGHAVVQELDRSGRILIPEPLREFADLQKAVVLLGQGNKFEIWNAQIWKQQRDEWLAQIGDNGEVSSELLRDLAL